MDNQIIETLDYLGKKIGIAIDWTAENIYPQVLDFMARYKNYEIVVDCIWTVLAVGYLIAVYLLVKRCILPARVKAISDKSSNFWFEYHRYYELSDTCNMQFGPIIFVAFLAIIGITSIISTIVNILDIAKWIIIPEAQFYDMLKGAIN